MNNQNEEVWVFNGSGGKLPSGIFGDREIAEVWIKKNRLSGVLTLYPINQGIYDWAILNDTFSPKKEHEKQPEFIQIFSSAIQEHFHFEDGNLE